MYTKGKWNIRGNTIFVNDTYKSVATIHVIKNYKDITFEPIKDVEAISNAEIIANATIMYEAINDVLKSLHGNIDINLIRQKLTDSISNINL